MKILVFAAYFYPHKGGYEKYILEIYKRIVFRGVKVDIITCNTNNAPHEEFFSGLKIIRLDCWNILGGTYPIPKPNKFFWYIFKKIKQEKYYFVNTQTRFFLTTFLGFIFAKVNKIKIIHTEHGTQHSFLSNPIINLLSCIYDHTMGYLVTRWANYNLAISKASGELSKHLGAKDYNVIYNGVDTLKFNRVNTNFKERLKIGQEFKVITFVGRLIEAKGVQDLIDVFHQVKDLINNIKLLIVGEGNFKFELQKLAHHDRDIVFLGERNTDELVEILSITDLFVNPSYSEGLPTTVLEALICGCKVIASDVGGTRELIDNSYGSLFRAKCKDELRQKIYKLLISDSINYQSQEYMHIRQRLIDIFDWNIIADKYLSYLSQIKNANI